MLGLRTKYGVDTDEIKEKYKMDLLKSKKETINIRGSVWINNAKYEYVDYLVVTAEEVEIYQGELPGDVPKMVCL